MSNNAWQKKAKELAEFTLERFVHRTDACGLYVKSATAPYDYSPGPNNVTRKLKNSDELREILSEHFRGVQTAGLHSQSANGQCRWFAIDLDCKEWYPERDERAGRNLLYAQSVQDRLSAFGFHSLVEDSNGIGGYHVWVCLDGLTQQQWVYQFLQTQVVYDAEDCGFGSYVDEHGETQSDLPETFPKQADSTGKFGNWLRLPGRHHRIQSHWSRFVVDGELLSFADSVDAWLSLPVSDRRLIPEYVPELLVPPKQLATKLVVSTSGVKGSRETAQDAVESMGWPELLEWHGWHDCGSGLWRRPGKPAGGHSAQINDVGLHVYSHAVFGLKGGETYGKWRFYVCSQGFTMEGNGQIEAARLLLGEERALAIDKEAQRAYAKQHEPDMSAVDISALISGQKDAQRRTFAGIDAADFAPLASQEADWLVEGIFTTDEPLLFGARSKGCKTLQLTDLAVAVATGTRWMNCFEVPKRRKVLFITGEANGRRIAKHIQKACAARPGHDFENLRGQLRIEAVEFPRFPSPEDKIAIQADVMKYGFEVVIVDPLYRGLAGVDSKQLADMGTQIKSFQSACAPALMILSHHVVKSAAREYGEPPILEDMTGAGIAETCGQWWLVGRNEKYQWDGKHDLCIQFGGREGQAGGRRIVFDERNWTFEVENLHDFKEQAQQEQQEQRLQAKRQAEEAKRHEARQKILRVLKSVRTPLSRTRIRNDAGLHSIGPSFTDLISEGLMVQRPYRDAANRIHDEGFILAEFAAEYDQKWQQS